VFGYHAAFPEMNERDRLLGVQSVGLTKHSKKSVPPWALVATGIFASGFGLVVGVYFFGQFNSNDATSSTPAFDAAQDTKPSKLKVAEVVGTPKSKPLISKARLVGIWAPQCAGSYGLAFTLDGRFSDGDEYSGEEGKWSLSGDEIIRRSRLEFETDFNSESEERLVKAVDTTVRLKVTFLDDDELTIVGPAGKVRLVKCPQGRTIFEDGRVFESPS
jgi:hypothetical protein